MNNIKTCLVHRLSAKGVGTIYRGKVDKKLFALPLGIKRSELKEHQSELSNLYISSDDKIEIGDYFIFTHPSGLFKGQTIIDKCKYFDGNYYYGESDKKSTPLSKVFARKIIASSDILLDGSFPRISSSYMLYYCKIDGADKVRVRYTKNTKLSKAWDHEGNGMYVCVNCKKDVDYDTRKGCICKDIPATKFGNCIDIYLLKSIFSQKEVYELMKQAWEGRVWQGNHATGYMPLEGFNDWLESENLIFDELKEAQETI